jgi:hypothetical protein
MKRIVVLVVLGLFALGLVGGISYGKGIKVASNPVKVASTTTSSYKISQNQQTSIQDKEETESNEAVEAQEANEPQESATEAENETLPGGGHSDPEGIDVDHQFEGVE